MTIKKHVTALGKPFDMAALRAKNEKVRAVGNMNVNARGDVIDSHNKVINDATKRVNIMYQKTMQDTKPQPGKNTRHAPIKGGTQATSMSKEISSKELDDIDDDIPNPKK